MVRLTFAPTAVADLEAIAAYIAADSPRAAAALITRLKEKATKLAETPGIGRPREDLLPGIHSFAVSSYVIFYRTGSTGIEIVRVLHGRRDLDSLFGQGEG